MVLLLSVLFCISATADPSAPVVELGHLHVHGLQVPDSTGRYANAYLGIPFAQPPVGPLRWANPEPYVLPKSTTHLFAQTLPKQCPQVLPQPIEWLYDIFLNSANDYNNVSFRELATSTSEDCLYLNVFTPDNNNRKRPVMVWIHGGAFTSGSSLGYDGRVLAISQDVVVVVLQYRVGVFGFLSTGDSTATGNWGLKDQTLALRWVQTHIGAFGGDVTRITIFGESAGAISCAMHSVTPYSAGLYQNAILQSGTEIVQLYTLQPLQLTQSLAQQVGCDTSDSNAHLIKCLRDKSQQQIFEGLNGMTLEGYEKVKQGLLKELELITATSFFPTVDGEFFPEPPWVTKYTNPGNMVVGFNSEEFGFLMAGMMGVNDPLSEEGLLRKLESLAQMLSRGNAEYVPKFLEKLQLVYKTSSDALANMKTAQKATGDSMFVANAYAKALKHHATGNKVYMYELLRGVTFFQDHSLVDELLVNVSNLAKKPADVGGDHADDLAFTFGFPFNPNFAKKGYKTTEGDKMISGLMMQFWGEFARTGTIRGWPEFTAERRTVLQLDRQEPFLHIAHGPIPEVLSLWTVQIPTLLGEMAAKIAALKQDL